MKVKISKNRLRKIILEETRNLLTEFSPMKSRASRGIAAIAHTGGQLSEAWGDGVDPGSDLIYFAKAYAGLGGAVQSQVDAIVAASFSGGGVGSEEFVETVYEQNPNAIQMAYDRLGRVLGAMDSDEALEISEALQAAMEIVEQGNAEVEADARAAGDR